MHFCAYPILKQCSYKQNPHKQATKKNQYLRDQELPKKTENSKPQIWICQDYVLVKAYENYKIFRESM